MTDFSCLCLSTVNWSLSFYLFFVDKLEAYSFFDFKELILYTVYHLTEGKLCVVLLKVTRVKWIITTFQESAFVNISLHGNVSPSHSQPIQTMSLIWRHWTQLRFQNNSWRSLIVSASLSLTRAKWKIWKMDTRSLEEVNQEASMFWIALFLWWAVFPIIAHFTHQHLCDMMLEKSKTASEINPLC